MPVTLLPPKMDFVFKRIFGNENHPNVLISFLNAVLNPVDQIESVELRETTIEKEHLEDKYSRLDVKAITDKGEHINIEIQLKDEKNMIKRTLYYWSKLYENQIEQGEKYSSLSRTICINLLDFNLLECESFHSIYRLKNCKTYEDLTDVMEIHFIELKKLNPINSVSDIKSNLEAWLCFINDPDSDLILELQKIKSDIMEAKLELIRISGDRKERERYEKRRESLINKLSAFESIREERDNEIAINLIKKGMDNAFINETTGLSFTDIERLRKLNSGR